MLKTAMIWPRFGPIQHARLRACAKVMKLTAIEMSGEDLTYAWDKVPGADGFERITLFPEADVDVLPPKLVTERLWRQLDETAPDVVVVPSWGWNYSIAALAWAIATGTRATVMTSSSEQDKRRVWWQERLKREVVGRFPSALVAGQRQRDYLRKMGVPADRIWTGYDCVDNGHFSAGAEAARRRAGYERARLGLPDRYFMSVCRFVAKKNLPVLLRAFARFRDDCPGDRDWHFVLLGDGPLKGELLQLRRDLGLDDVLHMAGFKQYPELPTYYGLSSGFVLPSLEEQWGLVANEAMAAGLPILISSQCGCAPELVEEGRNGFTFHPLDESRLASQMTALALDRSLRASMGERSREIISHWTCENFARGLRSAVEAAYLAPPPSHSLLSRALLPLLMRRRNKLDLGQDTPRPGRDLPLPQQAGRDLRARESLPTRAAA